MNLTQSYFKHRGWKVKENMDERIIAPFILVDSAYIIYEDYIKPMKLTHQYKKTIKQFMYCYRTLIKDFFVAFNDEQIDYIVDKMNDLHTLSLGDVEALRAAMMKNFPEIPENVRYNTANFLILLNLSYCANSLFIKLYKKKVPGRLVDGWVPMKNSYLESMVKYATNLFNDYTRVYARVPKTIDLSQVPEVLETSKTLSRNMVKYLGFENLEE